MKDKKVYIYGKHALAEALAHKPKAIGKIFLADYVTDETLLSSVRASGIPVSSLGSGAVTKSLREDFSHQGVVATLNTENLMIPFKEFMKAVKPNANTSVVVLGGIEDPHNVGAIIRNAAAFGVSAVLMPERNQSPVTGSVVKVSAGMVFRVPLVAVSNVNDALRKLKEAGFWVYGLEADGGTAIHEESFERPSVFVFGNESRGIREKTRELCDTLVSIPIHHRCESLNVASSAAVALYAWRARRLNLSRKQSDRRT